LIEGYEYCPSIRNLRPERRLSGFVGVLTIIGCIAGGLIAVAGVLGANCAPQEAAAIGVACAVITYCLARAASEIGQSLLKADQKRLPMGLTPCLDCGKPVSIEAIECPQCGRVLKSYENS
jgi:hypothetical protein